MSETPVIHDEYDASQIQILEGLEAVRKRPGMYIGSTSEKGLHHLVYEIVDNAVDEALGGYCNLIEVNIHPDNTISVLDNGRGIPTDIHPQRGISAAEIVFTVLHAGGKFGGGGYKVSGGLHGVGASVVNALSEWMKVEIYKDGVAYGLELSRGQTIKPLYELGETSKHGTYIHFKPDPEIFEELVYSYDILKQRLRETAFLTKGLKIILRDMRGGEIREHTYHYDGGIKEFVAYINKSRNVIFDEIFYCEATRDDVYVEIALQYNDEDRENTYSFVNNINTTDGGTHIIGFRSALTKTINDYARKFNLIKENGKNLSGDDVREGLTAIISIKVLDPQFESQTKTKLNNSEARTAVESVLNEYLEYFLEENPAIPIGYSHFSVNVNNEDYFKQLTAERLEIVEMKNGRRKYQWVKDYPRNEALDLFVYNRALAFQLGVDRWKAADDAPSPTVVKAKPATVTPQMPPPPQMSPRMPRRRAPLRSRRPRSLW